MNRKFNPVIGFLKTIKLFLFKKVKFDNDKINLEITMEDGKKFKVFRYVEIIRNDNKIKKSSAVFKIRFIPANMTVSQNIKFSYLPMMIFMGFNGFSKKYWMVDEETRMCQGVYEWETIEDALNYSKSIALTFMTKRSVKGSVSFEIIPQDEGDYWMFT